MHSTRLPALPGAWDIAIDYIFKPWSAEIGTCEKQTTSDSWNLQEQEKCMVRHQICSLMEKCCEVEGTSVSNCVWIWDGFTCDVWHLQTMFSASAGLLFFSESIRDYFKEESSGHEKFVIFLPSSGNMCKVLTSLWAVTFPSFLVSSPLSPTPYA